MPIVAAVNGEATASAEVVGAVAEVTVVVSIFKFKMCLTLTQWNQAAMLIPLHHPQQQLHNRPPPKISSFNAVTDNPITY